MRNGHTFSWKEKKFGPKENDYSTIRDRKVRGKAERFMKVAEILCVL